MVCPCELKKKKVPKPKKSMRKKKVTKSTIPKVYKKNAK